MISSSNMLAEMGSRPEVGSSRNRSSGSSARARARPARFFMPPESSAGYFCAVSSGRPTMAIFIEAISSINCWSIPVYSRNGTWMFSAMV
ncbi:hypothetical protein D3C83_79150 [compost metagenome]